MNLPESINPHHFVEFICLSLTDRFRSHPSASLEPYDTSIGKEEVQFPLFLDHSINEGRNGLGISSVPLEPSHFGPLIGLLDVFRERRELGRVEVEEV